MDDILILAPTRWKLKKAIRVLNETFNELKLEKHPDKTSMGRIEKGFDFPGYHFNPQGLSLAQKTIDDFVEKALRLYGLPKSAKSQKRHHRLQIAREPGESTRFLVRLNGDPVREPPHRRMKKRLGEYTNKWAEWALDAQRSLEL